MMPKRVYVSIPQGVEDTYKIKEKLAYYLKNNNIHDIYFINLLHGNFFAPLGRLGLRLKEMHHADLVVFFDKYKYDKAVQVEYLAAVLYDKNILYLKDSDLKCD